MSPPRRPPVVVAQPVRRYKLAIIEDPPGRVVTVIAPIPEALINRTAAALAKALPTLQGIAQAKHAIDTISDAFAGAFAPARPSSSSNQPTRPARRQSRRR